MKNYRITVNGTEYEVSVEEIGSGQNTADTAGTARTAPAAKPAAPKAQPKKAGAEGRVKIVAPMPGKIIAVKVQEGASVHKGDVAIVLEAMKMENEIYISEDGVVTGINVSSGDMVEGGDVLVTLD